MMTPLDLLRWQMAATLGMIELQRQLASSAWQVGMWWMPQPGLANLCAPDGARQQHRR